MGRRRSLRISSKNECVIALGGGAFLNKKVSYNLKILHIYLVRYKFVEIK